MSQEERELPPTCDTKPWHSTYQIYIARTSGFVLLEREGHAAPNPATQNHRFASLEAAGGGQPPPSATQNHGFVSQTKLLTQNYYLLRHSPCKLDLDTYLTPEAKNWAGLTCNLLSRGCDGCGPKIEGLCQSRSGPNF